LKNNLEEIFKANYSPLCNYATKFIDDKHLAKDIVQAVFIQLWEKDKLNNLDVPEPYLMNCVKYKCIDYLRSPNREKEILSEVLPDLRNEEILTLQEEDILPMMHYFADKLPEGMRKVFLLSRQGGMIYKEIANKLNISVKTVENQMGSALKKLRQLLRKHNYLPLLALFLQ